ncbi:MAG: PEP-CTERM sorting domain-containing protein [Planctomycetota bacterium]
MTRFATLTLAAASLALALAATTAHAQFTFEPVVSSGDLIPGTGGNFNPFRFGAPAINGTTLVFEGGQSASPFTTGYYASFNGGPIQRIVDSAQIDPGGVSPFGGFGEPAVSGDNFLVEAEFNGEDALYIFDGTTFTPFVVEGQPIPGGTATVTDIDISRGRLSGQNVAYEAGLSDGTRGVYTYINGITQLAAGTTTPTPSPDTPGSFFTNFDEPQLSPDGKVVFEATSSGFRGVYTDLTGPVTKVADQNDIVPGGTGTFDIFDDAWIEGNDIFFEAGGTDGENGLYASFNGGPLVNLVDNNTPVPGGTGNFSDIRADTIVYLDGVVAFDGSDSVSGDVGIYFLDILGGGDLTKLIADGDILDGKEVEGIRFEKNGFDGQNLAFVARFTDGSRTVYTTVIPEPSSLALLALGGVTLLRRRPAPIA